MSIRIRVVNGVTVALCAARSMEKRGDIYLDDAAHHALSQKFAEDFASEGDVGLACLVEENAAAIRASEELNNPNRDDWDKTFGSTVVGA